MLEAVGVIPARYRSTRFPGKALAPLAGRPMVQHVYERSRRASTLARVIVATDDERILSAVKEFGGEAMLTSPEHSTGTDRLVEVAEKVPASVYVNIQGDEPLINPEDIDTVVHALEADGSVEMVTLQIPITDPQEHVDPNVVKVVTDTRGNALYFSRSAIPYPGDDSAPVAHRHVGLYAFRRKLLLDFASTPRGVLERAERLEQLRVLEMGRSIRVKMANGRPLSVDTPEDLERVRTVLDRLNN